MKVGERLGEIGEDRLVRLLTRGLPGGEIVVHGAGDDCAVLASESPGLELLLKTDCVVMGVHFTLEAPPQKVGWKAFSRVLSDIGAMGGRPKAALVTVGFPPGTEVGYLRRLYDGVNRAARRWGVAVVGGETTSSGNGGGFVSVAMLGDVREGGAILRSGASPGDLLFVTGRLGGSLGGRHLRFVPRVDEGLWLAQHCPPTAMMDLSDGIGQDLPRLAAASGVGFRIDWRGIPRHRGCSLDQALGDGEDYELLFTVPQERERALVNGWESRFPKVLLSEIGRVVPPGEGDLGHLISGRGGWEHFRQGNGSPGAPRP